MNFRICLMTLGAAAALSSAVPAQAQPDPIWGGYYNGGVYTAGGGSEADGHITLQCAGDDLADAGTFHLELQPAARIDPFVDALPQLDFVIDGEIFTLPVTAEYGARFFHTAEPGGQDALALVEALRRGLHLTVSAPELDIADISLRGSSRALVEVERCLLRNG